MPFVNEYMSESDVMKYNIEELDHKLRRAHYKPNWTVDHERDIYLRYTSREHEEHSNRHTYCFYWKGIILMAQVDIDGGGEWRGEQWRHYKMWRMEIPENLKPHETEIMADLKEAFTAYKEGGVLSDSTTHTATFDF